MADLLSRLSPELCHMVADFLPSIKDILSLSRTSQRNYRAFNHCAYARLPTIQDGGVVVYWAAERGFTRVIACAYHVGISIDATFRHVQIQAPGWSVLDPLFDASDLINNRDGYRGPDHMICHPLHVAAAAGHLDVVTQLIEYGASLDSPSHGICKCSTDHTELGDSIVTSAYLVQGRSEDAWTPLHVALCCGKLQVAQFLLARDPTPTLSANGAVKSTALHAASISGNLELIQWLNTSGLAAAHVNDKDYNGHTPIMYAYIYGHLKVTRYLLSMGAEINQTVRRSGWPTLEFERDITILDDAIAWGRFRDALMLLDLDHVQHHDSLEYLTTYAWDHRRVDWRVHNPLSSDSVELGGQIFHRLLASSPQTEDQLSQFFGHATWRRNFPAMKAFLESGADINSWCEDSVFIHQAPSGTPLIHAVSSSPQLWYDPFHDDKFLLKIITWLLDNGASPTLAPDSWTTPLQIVCYQPDWVTHGLQTTMGRLLVDYGAVPHRGTSGEGQWNTEPMSPLESTISQNLMDEFEYFLDSIDGPSALGDDDLLGMWDAAVGCKWICVIYGHTLRRILELDSKGVIARTNNSAIGDALNAHPVPTDVIRTLLLQGAPAQIDSDGLYAAMQNEAEPALLRELFHLMPDGPETDQQRLGVLLAALSAPRRAIAGMVERVHVFLDAGVPAHKQGYDIENGWMTALDRAILDRGDQLMVDAIVEKQPLSDLPEDQIFHYIESCLGEMNPDILRSVIASLGDRQFIMAANAAWMSLSLFTAVVKDSTIDHVLGGIECLEHLFHNGVVFDMDKQDHVDPDASPASNVSLEERIDRASRAKQFLLQLTDLEACGREDPRMMGITWLFHNRIEFDGQSQPVFKSFSIDTHESDLVQDLPWVLEESLPRD